MTRGKPLKPRKLRKGGHGHARGSAPTPTYKAWRNMISRCNPKTKAVSYQKHYVSRGITVCKRWRKFQNFLLDMGVKPNGLTLERIDGLRGYTPSNCVWASIKAQMRNTSRNRILTYKGQSKTMAEWAEIAGMGYQCLDGRLRRGCSVEAALRNPYISQKKFRKLKIMNRLAFAKKRDKVFRYLNNPDKGGMENGRQA